MPGSNSKILTNSPIKAFCLFISISASFYISYLTTPLDVNLETQAHDTIDDQSGDGGRTSIEEIKNWNIFGNLNHDKSLIEETVISTTDLKINIYGISKSKIAGESYIIASTGGKPADSYKENEEISNNIFIYSIDRNRVAIKESGSLRLVPLTEFSYVPSKDDLGTSTKKLRHSTDNIPSENSSPFDTKGLSAISKNAPEGYLVKDDISNNYKKKGIKPGDVLLSINGFPLGTNDDDKLALAAIKNRTNHTVKIQRDGKEILLDVAM